MPLATSDFRNPICQEMRSMRSGGVSSAESAILQQIFAMETKASPPPPPPPPLPQLPPPPPVDAPSYGKICNEQGSVDSSDTYASCQTHPSHSQGDLTEEADSNLYVNPLESAGKCGNRVKKSASGEVGRNATDVSPGFESLKDSKVTLNDTLPKHRKIRIQQSVRPRAQFVSDQESIVARSITINYYGGLRGGKPFPTTNNSLTSATRIINHHLFGTGSGPRHYTGPSTESKLSLSADSIDSEGLPFIDNRHRVAKSILKKSESSNNYYSNAADSDTEKLITDNASTISMCDNETNTCDAFAIGTRTKQPVSPLLSRQVLESIFRTNNNNNNKNNNNNNNNNVERENEVDRSEEKNCASKMTSRSIFDDVLEEEKHAQDEAMNNKEVERRKPRTRIEDLSKDSQTMLVCSLRSHNKAKKLSIEEKRKVKASKAADTNCLPQEHRFSS